MEITLPLTYAPITSDELPDEINLIVSDEHLDLAKIGRDILLNAFL